MKPKERWSLVSSDNNQEVIPTSCNEPKRCWSFVSSDQPRSKSCFKPPLLNEILEGKKNTQILRIKNKKFAEKIKRSIKNIKGNKFSNKKLLHNLKQESKSEINTKNKKETKNLINQYQE